MQNETTNIEVCFAVYQRPHRVPEILEQLENQTIQNFKVNIWNNSGEKLDCGSFPEERLNIINSGVNQGSAARFKLVPLTNGNPIIFFDDDQNLERDFVEYHYNLWKKNPNAMQGWYSRIFQQNDYWHSLRWLPEGTEVDYIGTGGMVIGREIFDKEPALQNIPAEYAKVEDLFLSYSAKIRGMKLLSALPKCSIIVDEKDQYKRIVNYKDDAFRKLKMLGYPLIIKECNICGFKGRFNLFRKKDNWHPIDEWQCPKCLSCERHRFIWNLIEGKKFKNILHISPEKCLKEKLETMGNYHSIDFPPRESKLSGVAMAQENMDLKATIYPNNTFNLIICNHVLDWIKEDEKAFAELYRILSFDGMMLISVPIYEGEKTRLLDKPVNNHWWRCGKDYFDKLKKAGFQVEFGKQGFEWLAVCRKSLKIDVRSVIDIGIIKEETQQNIYRIKNPKVVVDIGSHIGGTALFCASKGALVYAYEPERSNFEQLEKNVKANGFQNKIHIFRKAVGAGKKRYLHIHEKNEGCHSFDEKIAEGMSERVQMVDVISAEEVFKDIPHCDFLKIDCEGAEYEFLEDLPVEKIDQISMELHTTGDQEKAIEFLKKHYQVEQRLAKDGRSIMIWATK